MFGFDPVYLIIMVVSLAMAGAAALYVKMRFARGQQVALRSGMSGHEIAERILHHEGLTNVTVHEHDGFLSDHYNPATRTLHLSPPVYRGRDAAAAGVAAHEVGHALQHARGDLTMWGRTVLVYPAHFGSMLAPFLIMIGLFMTGGASIPGTTGHVIAVAGVLLFAVSTVCSLLIVGNELNASKRARVALSEMGITYPGEEDDTVRGVLNAAAMTYMAAALTSLLHLLHFAYIVFGNRHGEEH